MYERYFYIHVHYSHYYKQKPVYKPYKQNLKAQTKADTDVFNSHKLAKFIALNLEYHFQYMHSKSHTFYR